MEQPRAPRSRNIPGLVGLALLGIALLAPITGLTGRVEAIRFAALAMFVVGLPLCILGLWRKPRWPACAGLALLGAFLTYATIAFAWSARTYQGASAYPRFREGMSQQLTFFPREIPASAREVVLYQVAVVGIMPATDSKFQARWLLPPEQAAAELQAARARAIPPETIAKRQLSYPYPPPLLDPARGDRMRDRESLPASFETVLLAAPDGSKTIGGVTIDTTTGEVVYWYVNY